MFTSKEGKKYGSAYVAKKKDAMHGDGDKPASVKTPAAPVKESKMNSTGETNKMSSNPGPEAENTADTKANPEGVDAGAVAAEHGPASHVTVHHSKDNHVVVSRHPDGHMHTSEHASAPDAHKAGAQLAGEANTENSDSAANEEQLGGDDLFGDDFKTPHLA